MNTSSYGAGYEPYHLEFVTNKRLKSEYFRRNIDHLHYKIDFYNSSNIKLTTIKTYKVAVFENSDIQGSPIFYSIDLYDLPISLLDRTSRINIIEVRVRE